MTSNIPLVDLYAQTDAQADRNCRAAQANTPWLRDIPAEVMAITALSTSPKGRFNRMRKLADRIASALAPHAACGGNCSHCCHVAVVIPEREAALIGEAIGRRPAKVRGISPAEEDVIVRQKFATPCPFLSKGRCSIYADRPIACRLHFNMADSPYFCDTGIQPEVSRVPNLDLRIFWAGYTLTMMDSPWADIRDFFPPKRGA